MERKIYSVEELVLTDSFLDYCLNRDSLNKDFWNREMDLHADQRAVFAEAQHMIVILYGKLDDKEISRQVEKIKQQILTDKKMFDPIVEDDEMREIKPIEIAVDKNLQNWWWKRYIVYGIAASLLVLLSIYLHKYALPHSSPQRAISTEVSYNSGMGERKSILLPDGTKVILNSNSRITLRQDYNQQDRSVLLNGEGFFRVTKDPTRPFVVSSGTFFTIAIGTAFYVHASNQEQTYEVDLLEGKVQLATNDKAKTFQAQSTMLLPGEHGCWEKTTASFAKTNCDTTALLQWLNGRISFQHMPVQKVLQMLERWYAVEISVKNKNWGKRTLTGDYDNMPLENILKVICFTLSCNYTYTSKKVIIE